MLDKSTYDVVIIGAGPIGLACGIAAQKKGLNYIIIEKGVLVNTIYRYPENMTFFSTSKLLEIGNVPFISHTDKPTRKEALEYYRRVQDTWKLRLSLYNPVTAMIPKGDGYEIATDKGSAFAKAVIVSTGFYDVARKLGIPGEDLPKVKHFYDSPHPYMDQKVLVVGAANSACDVALETYYKNAQVTMAIRGEGLYENTKYWIKPNIENRIKEGSIKAYFNTTVKEIKPLSVILATPEGIVEIDNDFVLAMIGYKPDYSLFEKLGLPVTDDASRTPIHNEKTLETPLSKVYVAGVIAAGMNTSTLFIENTREHGDMIISDLITKF